MRRLLYAARVHFFALQPHTNHAGRVPKCIQQFLFEIAGFGAKQLCGEQIGFAKRMVAVELVNKVIPNLLKAEIMTEKISATVKVMY